MSSKQEDAAKVIEKNEREANSPKKVTVNLRKSI